MKRIENQEFAGERPLFAEDGLEIVNVTIHTGESSLKQCSDLVVKECRFEGKYPIWHGKRVTVEDSLFTEGGRAAIWYTENLTMKNTRVDAPKMFRDCTGLTIEGVNFLDAKETLWDCAHVTIRNSEVNGADYLFMHSRDIDIDGWKQHGNYSFQYCRNVVIRNAEIHSKDAFWNTENITVIDSEISGEYLGWHSKNLTLINCRISGTQPLCYCENLVMENCTMDADCDLAFEYSSVNAEVNSAVTSIKNPTTGVIRVKSVGEIIIDEHVIAPADCRIETI